MNCSTSKGIFLNLNKQLHLVVRLSIHVHFNLVYVVSLIFDLVHLFASGVYIQ